MGMTRQDRISLHKKQEKSLFGEGVPILTDLTDNIPVLRSTPEGLVEYIRHNNRLYKKKYDLASEESQLLTWYAPDFQNSWEPDNTTDCQPGYAKDVNGFVHLRGVLGRSSGTVTEIMFTLPVGFRPPGRELIASASNDGFCRIHVLEDGQVYASTGGSNTWTSLSSITFYAG